MTAYATVWKRTGERRIADRGEWYVSYSGNAVECQVETTNQDVDMLEKRNVDPFDLYHQGDPCQHCGAPYEQKRCPGLIKDGILVEAP